MHDSFILNYPANCTNSHHASTSSSTTPPMLVVNGAGAITSIGQSTMDNGVGQNTQLTNSLLESLISQANGQLVVNGSASAPSYHTPIFTTPLIPSAPHDALDDDDGEVEDDGDVDPASIAPQALANGHNGTATPVASNGVEGSHGVVQRLAQDVEVMKSGLLLLNHQIGQIMTTFGVPTCVCVSCRAQRRRLRDEKRRTLDEQKQQKQRRQLARMANAVGTVRHPPAFATNNLMPVSTSTSNGDDWMEKKVGVVQHPHMVAEPKQRGRRSKYCHSASEKRAVAEFARLYGAGAAARKFNIPSSVAAYYQRKKFYGGSAGAVTNKCWEEGEDSNAVATSSNQDSIPFRGPCAEGSACDRMAAQTASSFSTSTSMLDSPSWNTAAATTGGPTSAFRNADSPSTMAAGNCSLRGRNRGRPKLIGDELDSELVDHLVEVKRASPQPHLYLSSAQVLQIARRFLADRAPGLLAEEGGCVKLRHTWAAKLLARISEREKELGLATATPGQTDASSMTLSELLMATAHSRSAAEMNDRDGALQHCLMSPTPPDYQSHAGQQSVVENMLHQASTSALEAEIVAAAGNNIAHFTPPPSGGAIQAVASDANEQLLQQQNALLKSLLENMKHEGI